MPPTKTGSPAVPKRGQPRSRSFQPSQKNYWKAINKKRERSPNYRTRQKTEIVGGYRIEDTVVGRGAWSVVKPAFELLSGREQVAKIVSKSSLNKFVCANDNEVLQEVAVLKHIPKHKNIVEFVELLDVDSDYYVILESLSNGDLCDAILECDGNRISESTSRRYFSMMTEALVCCHQNGVSHRDIKPENMLLSEDYKVKLTDFGLARIHKTNFRCSADEMGTELVGTLRYAAPELYNGHFDQIPYDDYISDVWSLGVCLYVMLAGVFPFSIGKDVTEKGIRDLLCSPEEIEMPQSCSQEAVDLLERLLQKEPKKRMDIRDILDAPWFAADEVALSPRGVKTDYASMDRDTLVHCCKTQAYALEESDQTIQKLRAHIDDLQKEANSLAARLTDSERGNGLKKSLRSAKSIDVGGFQRRSPTPSAAHRNVSPASWVRGKASSSPSLTRKPPIRSSSPTAVASSSMRSHDSSGYGSPVNVSSVHGVKPRTLSPGPVTKLSSSKNFRLSRPDSPSKAALSGRVTPSRALPSSRGVTSSGLRTSTPPKKITPRGRRIPTTSPQRAVIPKTFSSTLGASSPGKAAPASTSSLKPFSIGDVVMYSNKIDSSQVEGHVKFYGRVAAEEGGTVMIGIEVSRSVKGPPPRNLHDGLGYFECSTPVTGLLVPPRDCRLVQSFGSVS